MKTFHNVPFHELLEDHLIYILGTVQNGVSSELTQIPNQDNLGQPLSRGKICFCNHQAY